MEEPRSLDTFLEDAYNNENIQSPLAAPWQYWSLMLSLGIANSSDAAEILCISFFLADDAFERQILQDSAWRAGLLASAVFCGMLLGGVIVGTLGDSLGRKPMLMVGLLCNAIAGMLSAAATNVTTLFVLRLVAGLGIGATVPPLFTLCTELAPPSRRGFFVTVCASFWMVGSIYVAGTALIIFQICGLSWRVFAVACAAPSIAGAILVSTIVPESPRFLAMQGRQPEAVEVANRLAKALKYTGGPFLSLSEVLEFYPEKDDHLQSELLPPSGNECKWMRTRIKDVSTSTSKLYSHQLLRTALALQLVWFSLSFGSYGLLTWINTLFVRVKLENIYFNTLLFAMANLPGNVLSAVLMDKVGRSSLLVGSILAAAISLLCFAFYAARYESSSGEEDVRPGPIVLSACAFQCFTVVTWNTLDCMTSELFPTTVRSSGMGICAASGRIGAMIAQFVNGALIDNPVSLLVVASGTLLFGAATPLMLPRGNDMTGRPVEDELESDGVQLTPINVKLV